MSERKAHGEQAHTERRFQQKLQKVVVKQVILIAILSTMLFIVGQFAITMISNASNARRHMDELEESLRKIDGESRTFLEDSRTKDVTAQIILGHSEATEELEMLFWKYQEKCGIVSHILLTNEDGQVAYASLDASALSSYLVNYNNAICYNAKNTGRDATYRAVYYEEGDYADVLYVQPIYQAGEILGYASVFLSGSSWNFYLSETNFDGVITDLRDNAMYVSKPGLLGSSNKYFGAENGVWETSAGRYWVSSKELPELSVVVYSLVNYPQNDGLAVGVVILLGLGLIWYQVAMGISRTMAKKNAASIEELVEQIRIVRHDPDHRIQMKTEDEFAEVGHQINRMLENIMRLNRRNQELIQLNGRIELQQLTAQINPHFLYNTLETIRNLVVFDGSKAEELIIDLTDILRYSVDTTRHEVLFMEDMEYTYRYLNIQRCRFGDRLQCQVNITDACNSFHVPKLLIQPIIENSIKYGFSKKMNVNIRVDGYVEDSVLRICVTDDGLGMAEAEAKTLEQQLLAFDNSSPSIGLRNLSRRLYLRYGEKSGLRIRNEEGVGFQVFINVEQGKG